jgi:hypothetical protein
LSVSQNAPVRAAGNDQPMGAAGNRAHQPEQKRGFHYMTLKMKTREEHDQMRLLLDYVYDEEARIRHHATQEGRYRGDLVHAALIKTMEVALGAGISIGLGRVRYRAAEVNVPDVEEMSRGA